MALVPGIYRIKNVTSGLYLGADPKGRTAPQGLYPPDMDDCQKASADHQRTFQH